ncbi:phosphatidate phosphatase LPIN3-like [Ruditapes philippinarum]|uniref:phosphatidate phosphatase LPIN3-like n=1 Tax=Ruditapes philippinarum TaxID=129788 RepID=UPI00295C17F3|nr:phosphatidate phosphatase LPIN3-like [Ruditapes philippinarum]XP_060552222.1 phosphatidate phosphatase LPIN3-like [Ruditapes philippinarum]XP_060552223.1 phosphatidate phosphatase LPIN3-like [Ruditapes philippinarum]
MSYFSYVGKLFSNVKGFYQEINAATLTGAIDTIIIQQEDGSYKSSPFHVRFGKLGVLRSREKVVDIEINGEPVDIQMKLGERGEAFFVEEHEDPEQELSPHLATSPLQYDSDIMERGVKMLREQCENATEDLEVSNQDVKVENELKVKFVMGSDTPKDHSSEDMPNSRQHLDSAKSESTVKSEHSRDADLDIKEVKEENEHNKSKRKRRKRKKNKHKVDSANNNHVTPGENEEEIFELEDVSTDDELRILTKNMTCGSMSKSISLPAVEESKFDRTNEWASAHEVFGYLNSHPFSDTDLSPLASPNSSRPHSPKSDTEVDRQKSLEQNRLLESEEDDTMWEWGAMPRRSVTEDNIKTLVHQTSDPDDKNKGSGGLFQFMRKTKNFRHKPEEEGIYLDDLNIKDMDEETAKLYFPKRFSNTHFKAIEKDEDVESGRGASLPQSPHSVEGAIGGPNVLVSEIKSLGTYSLSLCGGLSEAEGVTLGKFMSMIVTFDDLSANPAMLSNPDLVVKIEDNYYNWQTAAPIILSQVAFQKDLSEEVVKSLVSQHMPKKKEKKGSYSWFSWRRAATDPTTSVQSPVHVTLTTSESEITGPKSEGDSAVNVTSVESVPSCQSSITESPKKVKQVDRLTVERDHSSSEGDTEGSDRTEPLKMKRQLHKTRKVFKKSLRLSSDQMKQLNLRPGQNEVTYSVTTQYQGTKRCHSHIYLWKYNDKIIVSDIDGTITKSDVLGQILPVVGRDWSQSGVAQLYSSIAGNGYKFLYLSARAIGQSKLTKDLLQNIKQGEMTLPEGPLLLSPTSLISAFHKEVIERKPEEFKISCLSDVASLFPEKYNPFYAGFGNKVNDVYAYKAIHIPISRIFTINPYGEIKHELSYTFQTSYTKLTDVADHFFPPLHKIPCSRASEFSHVQYWREPLPEVSPFEVDDVLSGKTAKQQEQENS